jgi:hypothetical protein
MKKIAAEYIDRLIKLTNYFDSKGLTKEANYLDYIIRKIAGSAVVRGYNLTWVNDQINVGNVSYKITVEKGFATLPLNIHNITYTPAAESTAEAVVVDASVDIPLAGSMRDKDSLPTSQIDKLIREHEENKTKIELSGKLDVTFERV